jgi:dihydroflavonol-4-reductase
MKPDQRFWGGKRVCVTGGTGFLGWHLVRQLMALGGRVRILGLRPKAPALSAQLHALDCVFADVRDPEAARQALRDCEVVFHTAGTVAVWGPALRQMYDIHLKGTQEIVHALPAGARLVHTSSVMAVGAGHGKEVLTEDAPFTLQRLRMDYVHAKKAAEEIALAAARDRDVVVVNPGFLLGPEDYDGSIIGRLCLRCWKGRVPLLPPGGMSFADVRDVAAGHLLTAEHGRRGRRYILGGENLTMVDFVRLAATVRGLSPKWWLPMPGWLNATIACAAELRAAWTRREPYPSLQHVRLNRYHWYYCSDQARTELGYEVRPILESLKNAHEWFCASGQLQRMDETVERRRKAA